MYRLWLYRLWWKLIPRMWISLLILTKKCFTKTYSPWSTTSNLSDSFRNNIAMTTPWQSALVSSWSVAPVHCTDPQGESFKKQHTPTSRKGVEFQILDFQRTSYIESYARCRCTWLHIYLFTWKYLGVYTIKLGINLNSLHIMHMVTYIFTYIIHENISWVYTIKLGILNSS